MKRHSMQILISLLIIALLLSPLFVYGYTASGEGDATLLQEGEYAVEPGKKTYYASPLKAISPDAEEYVYQQLLSANGTINLDAYNIPAADVDTFYSNVVNDHPDLFYVSGSYQYNYYPSLGTVANIYPSYVLSADEIAAAQEIYYAGAQKALSELDDSMSDLQKALTLHDYICGEGLYPVLEYDSQGYLTNDQDIWHSAYGFFYNKTVVCAGFSLAYSYLMQQAGIPCEYVGSDAMQHAWNKIQIDGKWYNVDLTYDNHDYTTGVNSYGSARHTHFMKCDAFFAAESGSYHYSGVTHDSCPAADTQYDSYFWDETNTRIYTVDGDYYYLKPNNGKYGILYLTKRTTDGTETKIGQYFTTQYLNFTSNVYDENGVLHQIAFKDSLARLAYLDHRFYVVAGNNIYSMLPGGAKYTVCSTNGNYVSGLGINENKNLIWQPYTDATQVNELDKLSYYQTFMTVRKGEGYNNYPDVNLDGAVNAKDYSLIIKK